DVPSAPGFWPLSLHDALPIYIVQTLKGKRHRHIQLNDHLARLFEEARGVAHRSGKHDAAIFVDRHGLDHRNVDRCKIATTQLFRSEERTSELQSRENLVCRLL